MTDYTSNQVRDLLRARIEAQADATQKALATKIGVSTSFLCDILNGNREPQGKVLDFLGLDRVVTYRSRQTRRPPSKK